MWANDEFELCPWRPKGDIIRQAELDLISMAARSGSNQFLNYAWPQIAMMRAYRDGHALAPVMAIGELPPQLPQLERGG